MVLLLEWQLFIYWRNKLKDKILIFEIMSTAELKNKIQVFLENADDKVLKIVNGVFENYYQDEIVAFYPDGKPMTKKEYISEIDIANNQVKEGNYISVEELENEE